MKKKIRTARPAQRPAQPQPPRQTTPAPSRGALLSAPRSPAYGCDGARIDRLNFPLIGRNERQQDAS